MGRSREFSKDEALRSAMGVFWRQGYDGSSVQDLLDAMGIHRKSMYDTFGDKHDLYLAALGLYIDDLNAEVGEIVARKEPGADRIADVLSYLSRNGDQYTGCMIVNATTEQVPDDAEAMALLQDEYAFLQETFEELLRQGQKDESVRSDIDAAQYALLLVNTWAGMRVGVHVSTDKDAFQQLVAASVDQLRAPAV